MTPVFLEVDARTGGDVEFSFLVLAVFLAAADGFVDEGDVEVEETVEVTGRHIFIEEFIVVEQHGDFSGGCDVVGEMDEALALHSFPFAVVRDAFCGRSSPEEGIFLVGKRHIFVFFVLRFF